MEKPLFDVLSSPDSEHYRVNPLLPDVKGKGIHPNMDAATVNTHDNIPKASGHKNKSNGMK